MANQEIAVELSFATLPEGWKGTPQEFLQWISENALFSASGAFLTGRIGGDRPTTDVGIWINGQTIETWSASKGKYLSLLSVPLGSVHDWPIAAAVAPENYLFCDGKLYQKSEYPDLGALIADLYSRGTDPADTFRVPDFNGRVAVGAGELPGDYDPKAKAELQDGVMTKHAVGDYFGAEWPIFGLTAPSNAPARRYSAALVGKATSKPNPWATVLGTYNGIQPPSIGVRKIMRAK